MANQRRLARLIALATPLLCGCSSSAPEPPADPAAEARYLSPVDRLTRLSMALKGTRPSPDELRAVDADPEAIGDLVDAYLESDEFGATIRDVHNEALLVRASVRPDLFGFPAVGTLSGRKGQEITASVQEAPLRLIEHVVREDRPYTEIVTADYLLADEHVATVWGLAYDGDGTEWKQTHWADGRPAAGILSDSMLLMRHKSTESNANRGRANAISKALLCYDFASREVSIDTSVDLSSNDAVNDALTKNPACVSCHQALDPLASFFSGHSPGFVVTGQIQSYPFQAYRLSAENDWQDTSGRAPGYFGLPGDRLDDLGARIAADPRFPLCAVKRLYAHFHQVDLDDVPLEVSTDLQRRFVDGGFRVKSLVRDIVMADDFRALELPGGSAGYLKAGPERLARAIHHLTGYRWEVSDPTLGTLDLATDSLLGFAVLAGGIDSFFATRPSHAVGATASLVLQRFAASAANHVVDSDLATSDLAGRKLLGLASGDETDPDAVRRQLVELHLRFFGEVVADDSPQVDETHALFADTLARTGDVARAWKVTLTAMLQDFRIAFY